MPKLILGHSRGGDRRFEHRRTGAPFGIASTEHVLVVGQRRQQPEDRHAQRRFQRVDHREISPLDGHRRSRSHGTIKRIRIGRGLEQAWTGRFPDLDLVGHDGMTVRISWRGTTSISIHGCSS